LPLVPEFWSLIGRVIGSEGNGQINVQRSAIGTEQISQVSDFFDFPTFDP